jgi:hypothetical protein
MAQKIYFGSRENTAPDIRLTIHPHQGVVRLMMETEDALDL